MNSEHQFVARDIDIRRYEYADGEILAADFGHSESASVDVIEETVIVIVDGEQYDIEIAGDARASITNGILTVEVDA